MTYPLPHIAEDAPAQRDRTGCDALPMPGGLKLALFVALSMAAFAARSWWTILSLFILNLLAAAVFRGLPLRLRKEAKALVWQTAVIVGLYCLRFGFSKGLFPGVRVSLQLFFAFLPAVIYLQTTSESRITGTLENVLGSRSAFVITTCMTQMPVLIREMKTLYQVQALRGAKILPRDLANPANFPDVIHCLVIPSIIRCLGAARDISLAAEARNFGRHAKRTCWPGSNP